MKIDTDLFQYKLTLRFMKLGKYSEEELLIVDHFLHCYSGFSAAQRRLWDVLANLSRKYNKVFPLINNLKDWSRCCYKTVSNSLAMFRACNFLVTKRRFNQPSFYDLNPLLLLIDLNHPECFLKKPVMNIHERTIDLEDMNNEEAVERCEQSKFPNALPNALPFNSSNRSIEQRNVGDRPLFVDKCGEQFREKIGYSKELKDLFILSDRDKRILSCYSDSIIKRAVSDAMQYSKVATVINWAALLTERCKIYTIALKYNITPQAARKIYIQEKELMRQRNTA